MSLSDFKPYAPPAGFDAWMKKVDAFISAKCGFDSGDLPDVNYLDWYEDGVSAKSAASKAIRYAKGGMDE